MNQGWIIFFGLAALALLIALVVYAALMLQEMKNLSTTSMAMGAALKGTLGTQPPGPTATPDSGAAGPTL